MIKGLKKIDVENYGSNEWMSQHEKIEKLNNQAHRNAINNTEKELVDEFNIEEKVDVIIYNLLAAEAWKENVYPELKSHFTTIPSVKPYMTIYHEATLANLLEVLIFHKDSCESAEESLVELIDYCYRKFLWLVNIGDKRPSDKPSGKKVLEQSADEERTRQTDFI
jgi:zinc finger MYND domain-containing protein 10